MIRLKKLVLISFIILCLLFTLLLTGQKVSVKANPNIIYVPTDYPTIQDAINHATSGDTIFVHKETYYEHVIANKSVSLIGEDRNLTIIDGGGTGNVIHLESGDVYISGFTIQNGGKGLYDSGIFIDHASDNNNISHNTIAYSSNGICLSYSLRSTIFDNTVSDNKYGISLYSSNNNEIYGNNAPDNKYGIALYSSNNNKIHSNNASSNIINGIYLHLSGNNEISSNIASFNGYDGISLDFSDNNVISDNIASNNDYGIRLSLSSNNLISGNTATYNYYGIYVHSSSDNNTIYHNNFNNTDQVWSNSSNIWDNTKEGNYWSDYTGEDKNEDGIGDIPYTIDEKNQDNNPLMGKFSDFSVTWKDKTHHVTTICNSTVSNLEFEIGRETGNKIMSFDVTGEDGTVGFCRVMIPTELMNYSYIVFVDEEEIIPIILSVSNNTHAYLYFTYVHSSHAITIISSKLLNLYNELLDEHLKLQADFRNLNSTYYQLLGNYGALLGNYAQLLESYDRLNASYRQHLLDYQKLLESYDTLNASYQQYLLDYYNQQGNDTSLALEQAQNIQNLTYVFIAITAIFIIAAAYLSTYAHRKISRT